MRIFPLLLASMLCFANANASVNPGSYAEHYRSAVLAYQAGDYPAMLEAVEAALDTRPAYPPMLEIRAMAEALSGDDEAALATLTTIADMQVRFNPKREEFSALKNSEAFEELVRRNAQLDEHIGEARVLASGGPGDFIPEGIAIDAAGNVFLSSIRHGDILKLGKTTETIHRPAGRHWSVFGMAFDDELANESLWFVSSNIPEFSGKATVTDTATSGLFRLDLKSGELERHLLPAAKTFGDLLVSDDTVYASDAAGGVWKFSDGEFSELLPAGTLANPQGLALLGDTLLVADYRGGLIRLDTRSGEFRKVANETQASLYGIDGLIARNGHLYAVQNGISPARVTEFEYSPARNSITAARMLLMNHPAFDEPTLLTSTHEGIALVANSHWNRFDENQQLPEGLSPPTVILIPME